MSILGDLTGIHISPKGVRVEPLKALGTVATVGSFGGLGPVAGALSHIPGAASAVGAVKGALGAGGVADRFRSIGGLLKGGLDLANTANTVYSGYQGGKLRNEMAAQADAQAAENAATRTRGIAGMQAAETRPDLSRMLTPPDPNRFRRVNVGGVT